VELALPTPAAASPPPSRDDDDDDAAAAAIITAAVMEVIGIDDNDAMEAKVIVRRSPTPTKTACPSSTSVSHLGLLLPPPTVAACLQSPGPSALS